MELGRHFKCMICQTTHIFTFIEEQPLEKREGKRLKLGFSIKVDVDFPSFRKRRTAGGSRASYLARPLEEVRTASYEERAEAIRNAEKLQENLQSSYPTFVKSMVRSHVYSCFWLGLPSAFCEDISLIQCWIWYWRTKVEMSVKLLWKENWAKWWMERFCILTQIR